MTDKITEAVARAIAGNPDDETWLGYEEALREGYRKEATAAIAAYREAVESEAVAYISQEYLGNLKYYADIHAYHPPVSSKKYGDYQIPLFAAPPAPHRQIYLVSALVEKDNIVGHRAFVGYGDTKETVLGHALSEFQRDGYRVTSHKIRECTSLSAPPTIPAGWKLVPLEPTEELRKRFGYHYYKSVIEAAPTHPSQITLDTSTE